MEELKPAGEVIKEFEITVPSRLLFVGDLDYFIEDITKAAKPTIKPHFRSLAVPIPLPDNSADFIFVWLVGKISIKLLAADITRICSPKGSIWVALVNEEDIPVGMPGKHSMAEAMKSYGWQSDKETILGKDYYALRFRKF